jgi:hypothetical protein
VTQVSARALIELGIDGRRRTDRRRPTTTSPAIHLALEHDERLCELLCSARFGRRISGEEVAWDQREQALDALDKLCAAPFEPQVDEDVVAMAEEMFATADAGDRDERRTLAEHHLGHGRALKAEPRPRVDARTLLEEASRDLGYEPHILLRPSPRGRLREEQLARRCGARSDREGHRDREAAGVRRGAARSRSRGPRVVSGMRR